MKDLREAIELIFNNVSPVKLGELTVGYVIGKYDMHNLVAEFNIHFIEPEAEQVGLNPYPNTELHVTVDNIHAIER
jgi:hypothetical protein